MENFLHPITWLIVFTIGIITAIQFFLKNKNIFRRIGIVFIILILYMAMDYSTIHIWTKYYIVDEIIVPILLVGFILTLYLEDYWMYKKSDKNNDVQRAFVKNTIQYFFVVVFLIVVYWVL